ncbi:ABC transporter permease [Salibacterium aidingense]|uniref:ABC transporter permease n=1 Tax=Salibacterium aidingense TaxID=384933 RepID=UPI003BE881C2
MTLFSLARKNIKSNLKSYGLYVGSTIFSILIYFTFVTLQYNKEINEASDTSQQISSVLNASSFVLIVFVSIFIVYSNSFFMKKRKKEVGLYSLLGIRKRSIGWLLFFENIMIGLFSLVIGMGLGFLLSQLFLSLLLQFMGLELDIGFTFSPEAIVNTTLVFLLIFLATSLQSYRIAYRFKLVELFSASRKGEELPKTNYYFTVLGILTLTGAYWLALQDITSEVWGFIGLGTPLVIIGLTILGTYLTFSSVFVAILRVLRKRHTLVWKALHLWTVSQLLYRIKANAKTLTIISILSATTITAGGVVFSLYYNIDQYVEENTPFSFMWEGETEEMDDADVTFQESIQSKTIIDDQDVAEFEYNVINHTTFTQLAEELDWENIPSPSEGRALLINPFFNERLETEADSITYQDHSYELSDTITESILNVDTTGANTLVFTDQDYRELEAEERKFQAVQVSDDRNQLPLSQSLSSETENFSSAPQDYQDTIESTGITLFVSTFLGLVFLMATGSIIFFKVLTEAEEDKDKYTILHHIGVPKKDRNKTIRHQVGIVFLVPLTVGLIHSVIALIAFSGLLQINLVRPVTMWMLCYIVIYTLYYWFSVQKFKQTVL